MIELTDLAPPAVACFPGALGALPAAFATRDATIAVVGLGYVGLPLALTLADVGYRVIGLESDPVKVAGLAAGHSHITGIEDAEVALAAASPKVRFSRDPAVLRAADVIVITVPTPLADGGPDLSLVRAATDAVAASLRPGQLVILESTTYPGTTEEVILPVLEASGLRVGVDFGLAFSPERVDPGSKWTVAASPKVVGGVTPADTAVAAAFYATFVATVHPTRSPREAEMAKLIENTFRQVNIALVNELAIIAPALGVDLWAALDAAATKPFGYLPFWPGPGVGGHCIAVDPSYLSWRVEQKVGHGLGFIQHALRVNSGMPHHVVGRINDVLNIDGKSVNGARIAVIGVTYKPDVADVRESAAVAVVEELATAGADLRLVDPTIDSVKVLGRRHDVVDLESALADVDIAVVLTPHTDVDYDLVVAEAPLVFDATGHLRSRHDASIVLL
jgi:nucleotide sugar dehydrogenase